MKTLTNNFNQQAYPRLTYFWLKFFLLKFDHFFTLTTFDCFYQTLLIKTLTKNINQGPQYLVT